MSLQNALTQAGLVEARKVEIPTTWKKCEIHGIKKIPTDSTLLVPLLHGNAGTCCTEWADGRLTIHQLGVEHDPKRYKPVLQKALEDIQSTYPQCEILWY
jgi:hypothetical protein